MCFSSVLRSCGWCCRSSPGRGETTASREGKAEIGVPHRVGERERAHDDDQVGPDAERRAEGHVPPARLHLQHAPEDQGVDEKDAERAVRGKGQAAVEAAARLSAGRPTSCRAPAGRLRRPAPTGASRAAARWPRSGARARGGRRPGRAVSVPTAIDGRTPEDRPAVGADEGNRPLEVEGRDGADQHVELVARQQGVSVEGDVLEPPRRGRRRTSASWSGRAGLRR